jgi:hypothetical protein
MRLRLILFGLFVSVAAASQAVVITFDALGSAGTTSNNVASPYTELGYTFTSNSSGTGNEFAVWQSGSVDYTGSPALFNNFDSGITTLTAVGGSAFNVVSIDLANVYRTAGTNQIVSFTGTRADTTTVTNNFTLTDSANMHTFTFTGMTNMVSMAWTQLSPYHQFDNVTLSPVPEPASILLVAAGLAAVSRRRRRNV